jgi:hypothetical protein
MVSARLLEAHGRNGDVDHGSHPKHHLELAAAGLREGISDPPPEELEDGLGNLVHRSTHDRGHLGQVVLGVNRSHRGDQAQGLDFGGGVYGFVRVGGGRSAQSSPDRDRKLDADT